MLSFPYLRVHQILIMKVYGKTLTGLGPNVNMVKGLVYIVPSTGGKSSRGWENFYHIKVSDWLVFLYHTHYVSLSKKVVVDVYGCHPVLNAGVKAREIQDKVPTLYWLPKLHKNL